MASAITAAAGITRSIQVSVPVLYIMWRSGDPWAHFGIRRFRPIADLLGGVGIGAGSIVAYYFYAWGFCFAAPELYAHLADGFDGARAMDTASGPTDVAIAAMASAANGFAEELVIAGFLLPYLAVLLGGAPRAVLASAFLFASYHIYQGMFSAIGIFVMGLVTCAVFALTRRLWPNVIAHAIADFIAFTSMECPQRARYPIRPF